MNEGCIINAPVMGTLLERDSWILEQNPNCAPAAPQKVEISVTMDLSGSHLDLSARESEICEELPGLCLCVKKYFFPTLCSDFKQQFVNQLELEIQRPILKH